MFAIETDAILGIALGTMYPMRNMPEALLVPQTVRLTVHAEKPGAKTS